jgi:hypothetical protein
MNHQGIRFLRATSASCAALLVGALMTGCRRESPADSVKSLGSAFSKTSNDVSAEDAKRNKELADRAMAAAQANNLEELGQSLQELRTTRNMTLDQRMAVQDAMNDFQGNLAVRADQGDPAAKAALDHMRGGHAR